MYEALGMWLDDLNWTIVNSNFQKKKNKGDCKTGKLISGKYKFTSISTLSWYSLLKFVELTKLNF